MKVQVKALIVKNFICSFREKEYISELVLPFVTALIISLKVQLQFLAFFSPLFLAVAVNSAPRSLLIKLVEEKSERFKETQKIMGMKQRSYTVGWILYGYIKTELSTIALIILWSLLVSLINSGDFGLDVSAINLFLVYFIYSAATLNFSLALSTMFSNPKLAGEVTTFITILSILGTFLVFLESCRSSIAFFVLLSIFPSSGISFAYMASEQARTSFFYAKEIRQVYSLGDAAIQLGVLAIFYFILYFYLDQVFPNEYGVAKHPLFFIYDLKKKQKIQDIQQPLINNEYDSSSALFHQELSYSKQSSVTIRNLTKRFGNFTAVDKLSISLYNQEILCLLGHNGAGKTTTISMLTGLIEKTSGKIFINGMDLEENIDVIRENVGICSQRDVLYDSLTVYEMLQFMGQVKGLVGDELEKEIIQTLNVTQLESDKNKLISILSGGNKRKLSLALAFIGGSSIIFLDEPTSGMDAMSRRVIWQILENVKKQERTLVLTTHHLDEAEILADRIAIMAAGKLLACGKSEYIKSNFGEGYQLTFTTQNQQIKEQIKDLVSELLPEAQYDPQSQNDTLLYQISNKIKSKLENVFQIIQTKYDNQVIINLVMNSLEDAFVNIGMDEEKFIKKAEKKRLSINNQDHDEYSAEQEVEKGREDTHIESQKINIPSCLNRPPQFIFQQQFLALFYRKWYVTIRSFSNYISIIIPFSLIVIGTLIINEISFPSDFPLDPNYFKLVLISLFVILAFCFNSSLFIQLPVLEREFNLKYALTVMGCRIFPYWMGTYAFDYILYSLFVIIFVVFSYIMQLSFITEHIGKVILTFINFGFAFISFSYFAGILLFTKTSTAMKSFPFINFFIVYCMPQNFWGIAALFYNKDIAQPFFEMLIYIFEAVFAFLSPFFAFQRAFQYIIKQDVSTGRKDPPQLVQSTYFYAFALLAQGIIYFSLTLLLEIRGNNAIQRLSQKQQPFDGKKSIRVDEQIYQEEERLQQCNDPIKIQHLQKIYENGTIALKDISVGVQEETILGLLGPNGAGKSTTFSVLTSLIGKSSGSVQINQQEVERNNSEIFRNVGICPQFDCIWENLTPVEHLYLFGRMKGLSGQDLDESVTYFIQTMQLEEYVNRESGRLSGGNKRKLCVSNALIGGPSIQFFDEPSTGVDPIARRFLWKTLKMGVKLRKSSVVITTHTMDEAESLCDKIAILINGQIYCLGSPQELRSKFGNGYNLILKYHKNKSVILKALQFKSLVELEEIIGETLTLHLDNSDFNFLKIYQILRNLVQQDQITDFTITQSSLESVFLQFSKQQDVSD